MDILVYNKDYTRSIDLENSMDIFYKIRFVNCNLYVHGYSVDIVDVLSLSSSDRIKVASATVVVTLRLHINTNKIDHVLVLNVNIFYDEGYS